MNSYKHILFLFIICILIFPLFEEEFRPITSKELIGYYKPVPKPVFTPKDWFNGIYQDIFRQCTEDSISFKSDFVRLYNQIDYSLFSLAHTSDALIGKNGNFCMSGYMKAYLGRGMKGYRYIDDKVREMKYLQDYLWKKKKILFLVIFPPEKAALYPENMPYWLARQKKVMSNYECYAKKCAEYGVNIIDFNRLFKLMKDTSRYLLIPPTGTHWSDYGAFIAADSLIRYLERKMNTTLPHLAVDSIELTNIPRNSEDDITKTMNLIWDVKYPILAHHKYHIEYDTSKSKLSALFVGDSFFWGWYNQGIVKSIFSNEELYYYDKEVYPVSFTKTTRSIDLNLRQEVESKNVLIILQVCGGAGDMGAGFIDRAYAEYDTSSFSKIGNFERSLRKNPAYLAILRKNAVEENISLDQMIRMEAIKLKNGQLLKLK